METLALIAAVGGLTMAGILKGATGLGYASSALPFLVVALDLKSAMALLVLPTIAANIGVAWSAGSFRATWCEYRSLYLAMIPGILVGLALLLLVSQTIAVKACAVLIVTYALLALARPEVRLPPVYRQPLQIPTGFLNGIATGLTGAQVMPLFPYVLSLGLPREKTVQVVNIAVLLSTFMLAVGLLATGVMSRPLLIGSAMAIAPALLGVALGNKVRSLLSPEMFKNAALATLLALGCLMLLR